MKITSDQGAAEQLRLSWQKYRVWVLILAVTAIHLLIAGRSVGPMYPLDEVKYLAGANVIAGDGADWLLCGSDVAAGYPAVLAPLWWLPASPVDIYQAAAMLSAALGALAMWPAAALARRFGAKGGAALAIGALVTLVPARALMDNYVVTDNPLTLLVLCAAILAVRLAQDGRRIDAVLLGTVAGLATVADSRAIPLAAVTVAWLVVRAVLARARWLDAIVATAVTLVLTLGGLVAQLLLGGQIFAEGSGAGDLAGEPSVTRIGEVILGQAFTQVVSWALLTALGLLTVASKVRADARRAGVRSVASAWWWLGAMVLAQAGYFVWVLAGSADYGTRFDTPIVGRYLDPFVVPLAVLGAVTLWVGARKRLTTAALLASAAAVVAYGTLVLPRISPDSAWTAIAVPGLNPFVDPSVTDPRTVLLLAGGVALLAAFLLWASQRLAKRGILVALVLVALVTFGTDMLRVDPREAESRASTITANYVLAHPERSATLAADALPCSQSNRLQFELAGKVSIVPSDGDYGHGLVVGPADWPEAEDAGYVKVMFTTWRDAAVWSG